MSEKPDVKTESAPKAKLTSHRFWWVVMVLVAVLLLLSLAVGLRRRQTSCQARVVGGNLCIQLERVSSPEDSARGLSGRQSLPPDRGMLFVFSRSGEHCFWMNDMNFPIDMVWLNADKKVVHIVKNAQPSSYPDSFCPPTAAKYVLEINAGKASQAGLKTGSQLQF